jgi:hypothetical protein
MICVGQQTIRKVHLHFWQTQHPTPLQENSSAAVQHGHGLAAKLGHGRFWGRVLSQDIAELAIGRQVSLAALA